MDLDQRTKRFRDKLKEVTGINNFYFNPPESTKMTYPCIVYTFNNFDVRRASGKPYIYTRSYKVILIGTKPYEDIKDKIILGMDYCDFINQYINDNLYHYVYTIFEK